MLRAGDVVTYCFSGTPENLLDDATGKVRDSVRAARDRGVIFDVGHGMMSFDWRIAEACISQGFLPDTISTDLWNEHLGDEPVHDLPRTLSKLIAAGMPRDRRLPRRRPTGPRRCCAWRPRSARSATGALADLCGMRWNPDGRLADTNGVAQGRRLLGAGVRRPRRRGRGRAGGLSPRTAPRRDGPQIARPWSAPHPAATMAPCRRITQVPR